jgi:hypothetical protein
VVIINKRIRAIKRLINIGEEIDREFEKLSKK